jgi:hypothetical protein
MTGEASIGVLCLDTSFTKIPGHIRNPLTFGFPVIYQVVRGATPERVVSRADPALLAPFVAAARELEAAGVSAITTACGFLILFQRQLADSVHVPVFTSSLLQLPMVARMLGFGQRVGLLVADEESLTQRHLDAAGAGSVPVCIGGMSGWREFREVILEGRRDELDATALEAEVLTEATRLRHRCPGMGALVIECTDLAPFSHAVQNALGVPVFDIATLTETVHRALTHRSACRSDASPGG